MKEDSVRMNISQYLHPQIMGFSWIAWALLPIAICATSLWSSLTYGATLRVPSEYATINAAINAASDDDTILVADGIYTGSGNKNLNYSKAVILQSENGPANCIIDLENSGRFLMLNQPTIDERTIISGFTITRGRMYSAGGILIETGASPTISNCIIKNNRAVDTPGAGPGGGLLIQYNSSPNILNCQITDNVASTGGGIHIFEASPKITNCQIKRNSAAKRGGGIHCESSSPTMSDCFISENYSESGGGIAVLGYSSPYPTIINCEISANSGLNGGGISCNSSSPTITNCALQNNTVNGYGGGIALWESSSPDIFHCTIKANTAGYSGGGISCSARSSPTIGSCFIVDNLAVRYNGGGLWLDQSSPTITNCVISGNKADGTGDQTHGGGGIYMGGNINYPASPIITNCTISQNSAGKNGGGFYCGQSSSPISTNSILWDNTPQEVYVSGGGSVTVRFSNVEGGYPGEGNINTDPLFLGNGNFRLSSASPCIDSGFSVGSPEFDIIGTPRPRGKGFDMGAYETLFSVADVILCLQVCAGMSLPPTVDISIIAGDDRKIGLEAAAFILQTLAGIR